MSALRALVKNPFKEMFYRKIKEKKKYIYIYIFFFLSFFLISHKNCVKTFLK